MCRDPSLRSDSSEERRHKGHAARWVDSGVKERLGHGAGWDGTNAFIAWQEAIEQESKNLGWLLSEPQDYLLLCPLASSSPLALT